VVLAFKQHTNCNHWMSFDNLLKEFSVKTVLDEFVCGQLIGQSCAGDMALVEMLVNNLLGRMVDSDLTVRMLCVRGLGNLSSAGPAQVNL